MQIVYFVTNQQQYSSDTFIVQLMHTKLKKRRVIKTFFKTKEAAAASFVLKKVLITTFF